MRCQLWEGQGSPCQLGAEGVDVGEVNVGVPDRMDELARLVPSQPRQDASQKAITGNIKRHSKPQISRSLIQLA